MKEISDGAALALMVVSFAFLIGGILMIANIIQWCINWKFNVKRYVLAYYHRRWKYGWVNNEWDIIKKWNKLSEQEQKDVDLIGRGMIE